MREIMDSQLSKKNKDDDGYSFLRKKQNILSSPNKQIDETSDIVLYKYLYGR